MQGQVNYQFEDAPLKSVFDQFASDHGFLFAYDVSTIADEYITLYIEAEDAITALYYVLEEADLEYYTRNQTEILIRPAPPRPSTVKMRYLKGQITSQETGEGLPFATLLLQGLPFGTAGDVDGYYALPWPDTLKGKQTIEVHYLGYESTKVSFYPQSSNGYLSISLQPAAAMMGTIVVTDQLPKLTQLKSEQALLLRPDQRLPSLGGQTDVLRAVQLLPGVAAYNDRSAALQVRGSQADENRISWDGMLLYNVDHFFGAFSAINADMVEDVRLYKNNFPIAYASRTASILEINSPHTQQEPSTRLSLGTLLASATTQVQLQPKMFLQLGARTTTNNLTETDLFNVLEQEVAITQNDDTPFLDDNQTLAIQPAFRFY
ncbi:MAG: TonB-dependent receptor, partial [Bacteroidota bacterium]